MARTQSRRRRLNGRFEDEKGASSVEYGLLVALIALAILLTVQVLGTEINELFRDVLCFKDPLAGAC
ncbi:MAG TPA: Flp family type IVb pilin [Actinomycetota bacterium]|nr:Flp family type IVb pilin [Actinomycetota bacterium]